MNQLGGKTHCKGIFTCGNIRSVSGAESHTYTYGGVQWKDLLTAFDGETITYDAIGNPTSYYNGSRWTFTWQNGRQLATAQVGTSEISFTYDPAGIRHRPRRNNHKKETLYSTIKFPEVSALQN